jgi:hypothetical protein
MSNAINSRLANVNSMIVELDSMIAHQERVIRSRFYGQADLDRTEEALAELAALLADRQALYDLWNEAVAA